MDVARTLSACEFGIRKQHSREDHRLSASFAAIDAQGLFVESTPIRQIVQ
jgi:hypothetical protein